jgi:chorismate dehydratase
MKLGCISYINVLPVTMGLETGAVPFSGELVHAEPTRLNALTRRGALDITAVSSIEYLSCMEHYRVVTGVGLSSPGAVQSVKLFSLLPLDQLAGRTVAVTRASATSRTLLQVLLPGLHIVDLNEAPELTERQPAVLLIGDQALTGPPQAAYELDLGLAWKELTGLPMVFAVWLARRPLPLALAEDLLHRSRDWGHAHREEVLAEAGRRTGLSRAQLERYFQGLSYGLGARELESLSLFYRLAAQQGLVRLPTGNWEAELGPEAMKVP